MIQLTQISLEKALCILSPFLLEDQPADAHRRIFPHGTRQVWNAERMSKTMVDTVLLQKYHLPVVDIARNTDTCLFAPKLFRPAEHPDAILFGKPDSDKSVDAKTPVI